MGTHMKTTIDIADPLFKQVQRLASNEGKTFRNLVEEGLQSVIKKRQDKSLKPFKLRDGSFKGQGMSQEFEQAPWSAIRDLIHGLPPA